MGLPVVTRENYYDPEINMAYMGSTQFKAFTKCEAATLAELRGEWVQPSTQALLVGGYIDAWFSGELPVYQAQHPELFKRDGTLKAEYLKAQEVIARMESDELYSMLMSGQKQVVRTGLIAGVPFKVKIDSLLDGDACRRIVEKFPKTQAALGFCDGAIVDQKAMKDMRIFRRLCRIISKGLLPLSTWLTIELHIVMNMVPYASQNFRSARTESNRGARCSMSSMAACIRCCRNSTER